MDLQKQIVYTTSLFEVDENFNDPRFMKVRIAAMHSNINRNNSRFSKECIENAKDSFSNIPILADVKEYKDDNGNIYLDYSGHSMHTETSIIDGESEKIIYDEKVVGIIPESNDFELVYDEETGNYYAMVTGLLLRDYGNYCCDILEQRGGKTDVSAEIACYDVSYSAEDKCLDVDKMVMCAVTLLGDSVAPGMVKARAEVFENKNSSRQEQMIQIMQELKVSLDNYNSLFEEKIKEGGTIKMDENKFEENISTELHDENPEEKHDQEEIKEVDEQSTDKDNSEQIKEDSTDEESLNDSVADIEELEDISLDCERKEGSIECSLRCSVSYGEKVKKFSVSLSEIIYALSELVNDTYSDEGSYYGVEVYDEDKYVIMVDYMTGRAYKQSYKCKNKKYQLTGDRIPVKSIYVTDDEINKLEDMKKDYSLVKEELTSYKNAELHSAREAVVNAESYSLIKEDDEFKSLVKDMDNYSVEELTNKADLIYARVAKATFATTKPEKKTLNLDISSYEDKAKKPYGGIFENYYKKKGRK